MAAQVPFSEEYERAILSTIFAKPEVYYRVGVSLLPNHFYSSIRRSIYVAIKELAGETVPIDAITVLEKVANNENAPQREQISAELEKILDSLAVPESIEYYVEEIIRLSKHRWLFSCADAKVQQFLDRDVDYQQVIAEMFAEMGNITGGNTKVKVTNLSDYVVEYFEQLEARKSNIRNGVIGVPTGFIDIDLSLGGLRGGNYIVIAARPSMGKSTLAQNIAENCSALTGGYTLFFSLESGKIDIMDRFAACASSVSSSKVRLGSFTPNEWQRINDGMNKLRNEMRIGIVDEFSLSVDDVRMISHLYKQECDLKLIIIDYFQLLKEDFKKGANRTERLSDMSRKIKILARNLDVPIIILSQLSRECERRTDKTPMLSDLRETGQIENDSDVVLMLYREEFYSPTVENANMAEVIIAKQRNGPTGTCKLRFQKDFSRFVTRFSAADIEKEDDN